jgi:hypothetical protein
MFLRASLSAKEGALLPSLRARKAMKRAKTTTKTKTKKKNFYGGKNLNKRFSY